MQKKELNSILLSLESGGRPKGGAISEGIPSIGAEHLTNDGGIKIDVKKFIPIDYFLKLKAGIINKKNILIVKDGATTGKVSYVNDYYPFEKSAVNEHVFLLKVNEKLAHPKYVFNYLKSSTGQEEILSDFRGATVGGISRKIGEIVKVPLPTLSDQIRIAEILSQAEALIAQRKESIALLDEYLKSTFLEMFGDPNNYKKTDTIKTIGQVCQFKGGGTPSKSKPEYFTGKIPWVSPKDMKFRYITTSKDKITEEAIKESSTSLIPKGAVLMVVRSGILKSKLPVAINKLDVAINQDMKAFVSNDISSFYLLYYFISNEKNILKKVRATTADNFDFEDIKNLKIAIPTIKLQTKFSHIVENAEALKNKYQESLLELQNMYAVLSQKAFKGELNLNENTSLTKVISLEPEEGYYEKRTALACYIINRSLDDPQFGDVKFQKTLHLTDYAVIKRNLNQKYFQKTAGPFDNTFTIPFLEEVEKKQWFIHEKTETQSVFKSGKKNHEVIDIHKYFNKAELAKIDTLIDGFKTCNYEEPEIISTLYAVWNNRIIKQEVITDEFLKQDFLTWDKQKAKYKSRLDNALAWMRSNKVIPDGWGKVIEKPKGQSNR